MFKKNIIVAGASGLVGQEILKSLNNAQNISVRALVRTPGLINSLNLPNSSFEETIFNYKNQSDIYKIGSEYPCDILFCCLGSTRKKSGSQQEFKKIEHDYPIALLDALQNHNPKAIFAFISSVGADKEIGFYLKNKRAVEKRLEASSLSSIIARPSLLLGDRHEQRFAEDSSKKILVPLFKTLNLLGVKDKQPFAKYAPVKASVVASTLVNCALSFHPDKCMHIILDGDNFKR